MAVSASTAGRGTLTTRSRVGAIVIFSPFCSYCTGVFAVSVDGSFSSPEPFSVRYAIPVSFDVISSFP